MAISPVGKPGDVTGNGGLSWSVGHSTLSQPLTLYPGGAAEWMARNLPADWRSQAGLVKPGKPIKVLRVRGGVPVEECIGHSPAWERPTAAFLRYTDDQRWEEWLRVAVAELNEEFPADVTD